MCIKFLFCNLAYLSFVLSFGCTPNPDADSAAQNNLGSDAPFACRIVATSTGNPLLASVAQEQRSGVVSHEGRDIGKWVPVANHDLVSAQLQELSSAIMRQSENGPELLIAYTQHDISGDDVKSVAMGPRDNSETPTIAVYFSEKGSTKLVNLTYANMGRHLAIIVDGEIEAVFQIQDLLTSGVAVPLPTSADATRIHASLIQSLDVSSTKEEG